jgi:methionyl-tRNA formyltransferase
VANGKIIFYGTAAIGLPILKELQKHYQLELIITQPDTRGGRNRQLIVSPAKHFALENNITLIQPPSLREPNLVEVINRIQPLIAVAVAYGQFIPRELYSLPSFKTINVHFSLLPAYRGAAPVQRAIENGENHSGITIFEICGKMDAGDIWAQAEIIINPDDTCDSYQQRLGELAAPMLLKTMEQIFSDKINKHPQDNSLATLARPVKKSEGQVDWNLPAWNLINKLRAFTPWPGLFFNIGNRQIKIISAGTCNQSHHAQTGEILTLDAVSLKIACGQDSILGITSIQPEGKKAMSPWQFSLGNRFPGRLP